MAALADRCAAGDVEADVAIVLSDVDGAGIPRDVALRPFGPQRLIWLCWLGS